MPRTRLTTQIPKKDQEFIKIAYEINDLQSKAINMRDFFESFLIQTRGGFVMEQFFHQGRDMGQENVYQVFHSLYNQNGIGPDLPFSIERSYFLDWYHHPQPFSFSFAYLKPENWQDLNRFYIFFGYSHRVFMAVVPWHVLLVLANPTYISEFGPETVPSNYYQYLQIQRNCEKIREENKTENEYFLRTFRLQLEILPIYLGLYAAPIIESAEIPKSTKDSVEMGHRSVAEKIFLELWEFKAEAKVEPSQKEADPPQWTNSCWHLHWANSAAKNAIETWNQSHFTTVYRIPGFEEHPDYYHFIFAEKKYMEWYSALSKWKIEQIDQYRVPEILKPLIFEHLSLIKLQTTEEEIFLPLKPAEDFPLFEPDGWTLYQGVVPIIKYYEASALKPPYFFHFYNLIRPAADPPLTPSEANLAILEYRHTHMLLYDRREDTYIIVKIKGSMIYYGAPGGMLSLALLLGNPTIKLRLFHMLANGVVEEYDASRMRAMTREVIGNQYVWISSIYHHTLKLHQQGHQINLDWGDVIPVFMKGDNEVYYIMTRFWRYDYENWEYVDEEYEKCGDVDKIPNKGPFKYLEPYPDPFDLERFIYWKFYVWMPDDAPFVEKKISHDDPRYARDREILDRFLEPVKEEERWNLKNIQETLQFDVRMELLNYFYAQIEEGEDPEIQWMMTEKRIDNFPLDDPADGLETLGKKYEPKKVRPKLEPFDI